MMHKLNRNKNGTAIPRTVFSEKMHRQAKKNLKISQVNITVT